MRKRYWMILVILLLLFVCYVVDCKLFMKERVLRHNIWEYTGGDSVVGDAIFSEYMTFKKDTIIYKYWEYKYDTLILKYQYFNTMKILDPKTGKTGKYTMKGANWIDFIGL